VTKSSPRVFVVVDPVQDYEESLTILGVHGSLAAAKLATRGYRRRLLPPTGAAGIRWPMVDPSRLVDIELRQGDRVLDTWRYSPDTDRWTHVKPKESR
jgi:hypothetical protein